jgi:hypothetical protein
MQALQAAFQAAGADVRAEGQGRLFVSTAAGALLIKPTSPAHLAERAFFQLRPFEGLVLHPGGRAFEFEGQTYEAITMQPGLRKLSGPDEALAVRELYTHADRVAFLRPALGIEDLVQRNHAHWDVPKPHAHPDAGQPPLDAVVEAFWALAGPLAPAAPARLRTGLFHEDLHTGNLLLGEGGALHVIDPDPVWHAPAILNLAHFLVMEALAAQRRERLLPLRAAMLDVLEAESAQDLDFFVLLAIFRVLVRRAFHMDYYHPGWAQDLQWYLDTFGRQQYLAAVRP